MSAEDAPRRPVDGFLLLCPCDAWQLDVDAPNLPAWLVFDMIEEALLEHETECVVLAAAHLCAQAAVGGD